VAKSDLGTKRICPTTGKKFYDLNKSPVISPYTGEVVPIAPIPQSRSRGEAARAAAEPVAAEEAEVETVSLEEADAEASGGKADLPESEDDIEVDDTLDDDDDSTFIPEEEEGEDDVTDIIGDVSDDEES
jgi:uncharacterized protein (TIGR02300 family)